MVPIWIDYKFSIREQVFIREALAQWNRSLNGFMSLEIVDSQYDMDITVLRNLQKSGGWIFFKVGLDNPIVIQHDYLAWANAIGGNYIYVVTDRLKEEWYVGVMLHEVGHLLGARHISGTLMEARYNWLHGRCVDYATLSQVGEHYHTSIINMNYCVYY